MQAFPVNGCFYASHSDGSSARLTSDPILQPVGRRSKRSFKPSPTTSWVAAGCVRCDGSTPLVLRLSDREFSSPEGDQQSEVNREQHRHSKAPRTTTSTLLVQFSALRVGCRAAGADADCDFQRAGRCSKPSSFARSKRSPPESSPQDVQRSADLSMSSPQAGAPKASRYSGGSNHRSPPSALLCFACRIPIRHSTEDRRRSSRSANPFITEAPVRRSSQPALCDEQAAPRPRL